MKTTRFFRLIAVLGFALAASLPVRATAPANDNYADAQSISGSTVNTTGNNTDATLQVGETNPGGYGGASVWFSWTAPSTGWFTIHTSATYPGNGLDTVLALFADGADVASAAMLGHNEESVRGSDYPVGVYPDGYGPSRLVFKATSGTVYKIAVHGYDGLSGPFELHLAADATPDFIVSSVVFSPASVDIASASASSDATVSIQTTNPFSYANFTLLRSSNGIEADYDSINVTDCFSGTTTNGSYCAQVSVPLYEQPGNWHVSIGTYSPVIDDFLIWSSTGNDIVEDDYLIPQANAYLIVANTGTVDAQAPVITSFTGLPAAVDLADGDATFDITFDANDAISGVESGIIWLNDGAGTRYSLAYFNESNLSSGSTASGTYTLSVVLYSVSSDYPQIPPGSYQVEVEIQDLTTNRRVYGPLHESLPMGSSTSIVISATPPANDNFANRIVVGPALPAIAAGSTNFCTLESGESNLNATTTASAWYEWTAPASGWVSIKVTNNISYDPIYALYTGSDVATLQEIGRNDNSLSAGFGQKRPIVFLAQSGTVYKIAVCGDGVGNAQVGEFDLEIAAAPTPTVRVTGFSLTPASVDVGAGSQNVTLEFTVASDSPIFPTGYMIAHLTTETTNSRSYADAFISPYDRISGTDLLGTYRVTLTIPGFHAPGLWNLILDTHSGVEFYQWTPQGPNTVQDDHIIPVSGGSVDVLNTGSIDVNPPVVVSLTGLPAVADVSSPVPVTLTINITDDASGLASGQLSLTTNSGSSYTSYGVSSISAANRTSGSPTNGIYELHFDLTNFFMPGDYDLELQLTDGSGKVRSYNVLLHTLPMGSTSTLTIHHGGSGYALWAVSQNFGPGGLDGELEDANGDGTDNLLCYAFNLPPFTSPATAMTPGVGATAGLPAISVVGSGASRRLRIEYVQRIGAGSGLSYRPQFCTDPSSSSGPDGWQDGPAVTPTTIDTEWERIVIEDSVPGAAIRFGRVLVEYTAP